MPESKPKIRFRKGKLPNKRGGFFHIHSGETECGIAYRAATGHQLPTTEWQPCTKLVNHEGGCGYADNTAF